VTCRMAAFLMTLDDPNCRNCFRLLLLVKAQPSYFTKYATNLRLIFRIDSPAGADDCCTIGSKKRSLEGRCHGTDFCLFNPHIFCHSDQCVIKFDKLCVHSATMRSTVVNVIHTAVNGFLFFQSTGLGSRVTIEIRPEVQVLR